MKIFTIAQAEKDLAAVLDAARRDGEAAIRDANEVLFVLHSYVVGDEPAYPDEVILDETEILRVMKPGRPLLQPDD